MAKTIKVQLAEAISENHALAGRFDASQAQVNRYKLSIQQSNRGITRLHKKIDRLRKEIDLRDRAIMRLTRCAGNPVQEPVRDPALLEPAANERVAEFFQRFIHETLGVNAKIDVVHIGRG